MHGRAASPDVNQDPHGGGLGFLKSPHRKLLNWRYLWTLLPGSFNWIGTPENFEG